MLLEQGGAGDFDHAPWADRVERFEAVYKRPWALPVIGEAPAPPAVLIRPDGYVAWAGALGDAALPTVLTKWFGAP